MPKVVYVSSPLKGLELAEAVRIARVSATKIKHAGFIPVSPVLSFIVVYDEEIEPERTLEACLELLKRCDAIYVAEHEASKSNKGILAEIELAEKLGLARIETLE